MDADGGTGGGQKAAATAESARNREEGGASGPSSPPSSPSSSSSAAALGETAGSPSSSSATALGSMTLSSLLTSGINQRIQDTKRLHEILSVLFRCGVTQVVEDLGGSDQGRRLLSLLHLSADEDAL